MHKFFFFILFFSLKSFSSGPYVTGNNFSVLQTQEIEFTELVRSVPLGFNDALIPQSVNLRNLQSSVKHQGQRGSCSYFAASSLVESLIYKKRNIEVDISEEFIAWAGKSLKGMREYDEDSSVAVNLATIQQVGFLLEKDFPYQESWFNPGMPCENAAKTPQTDKRCFSHDPPTKKQMSELISGENFVFSAVDSRSIDVIKVLAEKGTPVTISIKGHPDTWANSSETGVIQLTAKMKKECLEKTVRCSGHAVLAVGYDLKKRHFIFKNSWGEDWGDRGYGFIDFDYMDQMSARKFMTGEMSNIVDFDLFGKK